MGTERIEGLMADSVWASIKCDWHGQALCRDLSPEESDSVFQPNNEEDPGALAFVQGSFCNTCPVRGKCLNSAIINKDWGLWAGTTRKQRMAMARNRSRAKCPLCAGPDLVAVDEYEVCVRCGASWQAENRPAVRDTRPRAFRLIRDMPEEGVSS